MEIQIDFSALTALTAQIKKAPEVVREELLTAMTEADSKLQLQVQAIAPSASGHLKGSFFHVERVKDLAVEGFVGNTANYVAPVELGSRPHFPPIEPLIDWVKLRFQVKSEREARSIAFLVARKISRVGTKGQKMFEGAFVHMEPEIRAIFEHAQRRIAERIVGAA